jgi:hypothetical protein
MNVESNIGKEVLLRQYGIEMAFRPCAGSCLEWEESDGWASGIKIEA